MKTHLFVLFLLLLFNTKASSQYILQTPDGQRVQLKSNGTWHYLKEEKSKNSTSTLKETWAQYFATNKQFSIWYNPAEWICDSTRQKDISGWDATFNSKDYAVTAYCLASRLSLPADELEYTMRMQWQDAGKITAFMSYKDTINGVPVTSFDMKLEANKILYTYKGFTYSTLRGSFQFLVGTQDHIFEEDKAKIEALIRGFRKL